MENQPQSSENQPKPLFAEAVKSISQNSRAQKLLHLLLEDTLPPDEELTLTNTRAHLAELRSSYPTTQEILLDLVQVIDHEISIPEDPQLSPEEYTQAVQEKQHQYRQALQDIVQALEPVYQEFGASEKSHEHAVDVLTEKVTKHTVEGEELSDFDFQRMQNLILSLDPQSLTNHQRKGDQRTLVLNSYNILPEEYKTQEVEEIITEINDSLEDTSQKTSSDQESQSSFEVENTKEESIENFKNFIQTHKQQLKQLLNNHDIEHLTEFIYSQFYSAYIPDPELTTEQITTTLTSYTSILQETLHLSLNEIKSQQLPIKLQDQGGWLFSQIEDGYNDDTPLNRLYLNSDLLSTPSLFRTLNENLVNNHISCALKIPLQAEPSDIYRSDKMVIYANEEHIDQIYEIVQDIYNNNPSIFLDKTPAFTNTIHNNKDSKQLSGVGIAEEPCNNQGQSFGGLRSQMLAELTHRAYEHNPSLLFDDPSFPLEKTFAEICKKYHVDPDNPASNLPE